MEERVLVDEVGASYPTLVPVPDLPKQDERLAWADLCRLLAIFGVIVIHATGPAFDLYGSIATWDWWLLVVFDALARGSVPLFVMLSGALLLNDRHAPMKVSAIGRRVKRVAIPLIVWSLLHVGYLRLAAQQPFTFSRLLVEPAMYHLWFVYMIVGLYAILPVLDAVYRYVLNRRDLQWYLLALWFVVTCAPTYLAVPLLPLMQLTSLLGYGGYFVMGAVLATTPRGPRSATFWWLAFGAGVVATVVLTAYFAQKTGTGPEQARAYFTPNVALTGVAAFMVLSRIRPDRRAAELLARLSGLTFMVYFMHVVVLVQVSDLVAGLGVSVPQSIQALVSAGLTMAVSLAIAAGMRLLPKSKVLLG